MRDDPERYCADCGEFYLGDWHRCPCAEDYDDRADDLYEREREPEYEGD